MKRLAILSWLLIMFINPDLISQSKEAMRNKFYDAESLYLYESFKEALPIYLTLLKINPDNSNYKYRIGQCYLNIDGEKKKAVSYLEDAVKHINPAIVPGKFGETDAPEDAIFFLANAYLINNQFDKARETYEQFKIRMSSKVYDSILVELQIKSCLNAMDLIKRPVYVKKKNLGNIINGANSESYPVVSDNEDLIFFSRGMPFYDAILYSKRENGIWSVPVNMNELLKVDNDLYPTSLSKDNKTLYLYSNADYDGTIYISRFENGKWSSLIKLNDNINTKYWESHATVSHDNSKLYFTSNRKGSIGGLDIYVSKRDGKGDWGAAENLGPVINTIYNEESPFLSEDDKTLFFSSKGHTNMGGYDIFYSTMLDDGNWSVPLNIGYPLNTSDDDLFYKPQKDGFEGYIAKDIPGGFGKQDIYRVEIFSDKHPRKFFVNGVVKVDDLISNLKNKVKISARNINNPNQTLIAYSNPETGGYSLNLPQGNFDITYEIDGGKKVERNLNIPLTNPSDSLELPATMIPKAELAEAQKTQKVETIPAVKGKAGHIPVKAESKQPTNKEVEEYLKLISDKEIAELYAKLLSRATGDLLDVIRNANIADQKFGRVDDLISYLKGEAAKKGIDPEKMDILALKVAVMDNILTQAAVDLLEKYAEGELKKILSDVDIYKSHLKTWTDLLDYITSMSGGKFTSADLNRIAAAILADNQAAISKLREKILAFSNHYKDSVIIRKSVAAVDLNNIMLKEKWLLAFYNEAVKQGLTQRKMTEMLVMVSSYPGTNVEQYLSDLIKFSEEPLLSSLKTLDLKRERIKSSADLIMFLTTAKDKEKYPEEAVFKSIANLILANDIPSDIIASRITTGVRRELISLVLWIALGACLIFFIILFRTRRKKNRNR
jgi:tetratricopeptide (TPR) repeat protein